MTDYGATDTSTTSLGANQFPVSAVWVANDALRPVQGGPVSTDGGGKKSAPQAVYVPDGNDVTLGLTTQTKATDGSATSWSAIQLLKGILDKLINGNVPVSGTFWQATQPVSGTVTETNSAAILTDTADIETNTANIPAQGQAAMAASMPVVIASNQSAVPVSGTFWQATQPVSGTFWQATQPISGTVATNADTTIGGTTAPGKELTIGGKTNDGTPQYQPLPEGAGGRSVIVEGFAGGTAVPVSGTFWQATQPVSGTVTANQGGAPWSDNITQFGGTNVSTGTGAGGAGIPRVTVSNDSSLAANQSVNMNQVSGTNVVTGGVAGLLAIGGPVASAGANADNPVKIGGVFNTTQPTVTNGQIVDLQATARGAQIVATGVDTFNATINAALPTGANTIGNVKVTDGTNTANVLAATSVSNAVGSQAAQLVAGAFSEQASLSAGALNADLVASTDISNYACGILHINANAYVGTLTFAYSNDNSQFIALPIYPLSTDNPAGGISTLISTSSVMYLIFKKGRYFRARMTSYTSGAAQGTIEWYTQVPSYLFAYVQAYQQSTWTVQPGNTANTTPWLASDHDGTTKAQNTTSTGTNSNGAARLVAGAYQEVAGQGTGVVNGINTDLFPSTDVSAYKWLSLQIAGTWSGTLTFQGSNDNVNFQSVVLSTLAANPTSATNTTSNNIFFGTVSYRYLRVRMTSFTSNTSLVGTLELYTSSSAFAISAVTQNGTWTAQPGNTQNTTPWLVSMGPPADLTLIASAAFTTTQTTADQSNFAGKGLRVVLSVTNAGTGSVTLEIDAKDVASGVYSLLLTGVAVTTNSTNIYVIHPELTAAANSIAKDVLPHTWRVKVTANNANSITYSVGASFLT